MYNEPMLEDRDERLENIQTVGQSLRGDIQRYNNKPGCFPPPTLLEIDILESEIPPYLLELLWNIVHGETGKIDESERLVIVSICYSILLVTQKKSYISPLLLAVSE